MLQSHWNILPLDHETHWEADFKDFLKNEPRELCPLVASSWTSQDNTRFMATVRRTAELPVGQQTCATFQKNVNIVNVYVLRYVNLFLFPRFDYF